MAVYEKKTSTKLGILAGLSLLLCLSQPGLAQSDATVGEVLKACKSRNTSTYQDQCYVTVLAIKDTATLFGILNFCLPKGRNHDEAVIQGFIKWAEARRDAWNLPAMNGVPQALKETYPCPVLNQ